MDFSEYIKPELLVLAVALVGVGAIFKQIKAIKDNWIPLLLLAIGIVLACLYVFGTEGINPTSIFTAIIQGALCAATAVFSNQIVKQAKKGE
mgnify:CR=1 FL=1